MTDKLQHEVLVNSLHTKPRLSSVSVMIRWTTLYPLLGQARLTATS